MLQVSELPENVIIDGVDPLAAWVESLGMDPNRVRSAGSMIADVNGTLVFSGHEFIVDADGMKILEECECLPEWVEACGHHPRPHGFMTRPFAIVVDAAPSHYTATPNA